MIINACAEMRDLDRAFATWAELEQLGLKPDAGTFNALLHTCVATREVASGRRLLARMAQDDIAPDAVTYMHLASLQLMRGELNLAFKSLEQCKEAGLKPHGRMYVTLINACCRSQSLQPERAQALLDEMVAGEGYNVSRTLQERVADAQSGRGIGRR